MIGSSFGQQLAQYQTSFLVEEKILASPASAVTFTGLDIVRDGGYVLELMSGNQSGSNSTISWAVNGDKTITNYSYERFAANDSGITGQRLTSNGVVFASAQSMFGKFDINYNPSNSKIQMCVYLGTDYAGSYLNLLTANHLVTVSNLNSFEVYASVANTFPAGTVARLYRKLNGNTATFIPLQSNLVADFIVPTATTDVVISNLDLDLHGGYDIECSFVAAAGSNAVLYCYPNQNTSSANYRRRYVYGAGTNSVGGGGNDTTAITQFTNGNNIRFKLEFYPRNISTNVVFYYQSQYFTNLGEIYTISGHINNNDNFGNITSLLFRSSVASGIGAGTRIQVYRRK